MNSDVALARLVARHMARRMGMTSDELLGPAWEGVLRARRTWNGSGSWEAWCKWLIRGSILNSVKIDNRIVYMDMDTEPGPEPEPEPWLTVGESGLTDAERLLLRWRYWENYTLEQIGDMLGLTKQAALGRIKRVLSKLTKSLGS